MSRALYPLEPRRAHGERGHHCTRIIRGFEPAHVLPVRGTQSQFLENICSENDLRSRILGTFVVKLLACQVFEHLKNGIIANF